ncbi:hypothetical protein GSI_04829 [Ganoderma sinense ZZ0214-1]|uniref:Uncharacterized protein n=1 Tax=Ganoderma sinense ZZ0214-1 TaxID=1077348 RepID=A0A2G8SG21_9APHY|nr:hypothetical protein GSI_04829 [Ganoderma sinense ZZ0214-1]
MSSTPDIVPSVDIVPAPCTAPLPEHTPAPHSESPPAQAPSPLVRFVPEPTSRPEPATPSEPEPMQVDVASDARHDLIEQIFQRVEEETARRAQAEEERSRPSTASKPPSIPSTGSTPAPTVSLRDPSSATVIRDRRRGSISVSRFGQPRRIHLQLWRIGPEEQTVGEAKVYSMFASYARRTAGAQTHRTRRYVKRVTAQRRVVGERVSCPSRAFPAVQCAGVMPPYGRRVGVCGRGGSMLSWPRGVAGTEAFSPSVLLGSLVLSVAASVLARLLVLQRVARASGRLVRGGRVPGEFVVGYGEETCFVNLEASVFALPVF